MAGARPLQARMPGHVSEYRRGAAGGQRQEVTVVLQQHRTGLGSLQRHGAVHGYLAL